MSSKHFLLLQGVATPFFSQLGQAIQEQGHQVTKVNFCGGDRLFCKGVEQISFRGKTEDLAEWITNLLIERKISDAILFGDSRPVHRSILPSLKVKKVRIHVFEEGYFRPHWVTLEEDGVNGYSPRMNRSVEQWHSLATHTPTLANPIKMGNNFKYRAFYDITYRLANGLLQLKYPFYENHRPHNGMIEYLGWAKRFTLNAIWRKREDKRTLDAMLSSGAPFYLLPLQLESDAQIHTHSSFDKMSEVINRVIESFAQNAPKDSFLVIKNHPLSTGIPNHNNTVLKAASLWGIKSRIIYIETGDLGPLLKSTQGTILVNSTTATQAMYHNSPVIALGKALFNLPGLTFQDGLDRFWTEGSPPDTELLSVYRRVLMHETQINGDFYSPKGIQRAIEGCLLKLDLIEKTAEQRFNRTLVITGASKGIGEALALAYANPNTRLGLIARDAKSLKQVAKTCRQQGAEVFTACIDVRDSQAVTQWLTEFDQQHEIDLLITNAGVTLAANADGSIESLQDSEALLQVNLMGTVNCVTPVVERMRHRGKGQIAMVSSLAAYFGMPVTPIYCASKAAIKNYAESLRGLLKDQGVKINVICPGFIETGLSQRFPGERPFLLTPEKAAQIIIKGLEKNRSVIAFPKFLAIGMKSLQFLPFPIASFFMGLSGYNRAKKGQ